MNREIALMVTSMLTAMLASVHLADDVVRGYSPPGIGNVTAIMILVLWLYGALVLARRRAGYVIVLVLSLLGAGVPALHFRGPGVASQLATPGAAFFIWTLLALGACAAISAILAILLLWDTRASPTSVAADRARG